jgi:hypothetical protein
LKYPFISDISLESFEMPQEILKRLAMLDASPLIIRKLQKHCYHSTGLRAHDYR